MNETEDFSLRTMQYIPGKEQEFYEWYIELKNLTNNKKYGRRFIDERFTIFKGKVILFQYPLKTKNQVIITNQD